MFHIINHFHVNQKEGFSRASHVCVQNAFNNVSEMTRLWQNDRLELTHYVPLSPFNV